MATKKRKSKSTAANAVDRRLKTERNRRRGATRTQLARALDLLNEVHPFQSTIEIKSIDLTANAGKWSSPWVIVARIRFRGEIGYDQLYQVLESWMSRKVLKAINPERVARLRIVYNDRRQGKLEYTLAETAPWINAIPRALEETDPTDTESSHANGAYGSLAARYGITRNRDGKIISGSLIPSIDIWLSEKLGFDEAS
jgi:hypothetical protein